MQLPVGCHLHSLPQFDDERGSIAEMFTIRRAPMSSPVQWNLVRSHPGTLRGMHVHLDRADYIVMLSGHMLLGLKDLRGKSPSFGLGMLARIGSERPMAVEIPVGVLHGFYFPEGGIHAYALSAYWEPNTDIGCRWDDPDLGWQWPVANPVVAERDLRIGSLEELLRQERVFEAMSAGSGA